MPLKHLRDRYDGQGLLEYALIVTLIAMACIVTLALLGQAVDDFFGSIPLPSGG
jgi:Flp pilus assembly pilin Flp